MKLTSKSVDVVVKEEKEEDRVWGVAYCVSREEIEQIFDYLLLFLLFIFLNQHSLFTLNLKKEITGTSLFYFCNPQSPKKSFLLKKREKDGYTREEIQVFSDDSQPPFKAFTYVATTSNIRFAGPIQDEELASKIFEAEGPSGKNRDYLYKLHDALVKELNVNDPHISLLHKLVRELEEKALGSKK